MESTGITEFNDEHGPISCIYQSMITRESILQKKSLWQWVKENLTRKIHIRILFFEDQYFED